ncbi:hypothetical protein CSB20_06580 [bacterium DOLZORAL124_64_63]|nr:MAG: hypothetical protein CSB20_06580 [bacterium DOLZORAL124_64_63]
MNFRERKKGRGLILNVTSLIDVMFLLLIFFMVTSTFRNQPAINLVLPRSATAQEVADTPAVLFLTENGEVYLNDTLIPAGQLMTRLESLHATSKDNRMVLRADQAATHGDVVQLIDNLKESGFTRVSLSARPAAGR